MLGNDLLVQPGYSLAKPCTHKNEKVVSFHEDESYQNWATVRP